MSRVRLRVLFVALGLLSGVALVYWPILQDRVLAGRDIFRLFIPDAAFLAECLSLREWPLWNPYQRLGQPFAATLYSQAFYPPRVLLVLLTDPAMAITLEQVLHALVAALGTYALGRTLRLSPVASFAAGALFGFGETLTHLAIQQNVVDSAAWTGFLLAAATRLARRPTGPNAAAIALTFGLSLLAGSPETALWQLLLVAAICFTERRGRASLKAAWIAASAGALGLGVAAVQVLPALELTRHSIRVVELAGRFEWSMPWVGLAALGWPNADRPRESYWGSEQNFVPSLFVGSLAVALAVAAITLLVRRRRRCWPYVGGAVLFALLALGAHFPPATWLLRLPPFSLFRYPSKYIIGCVFCLCVLAGLGLDRVAAYSARVSPSAALLRRAIALLAMLLAAAVTVLVAAPLRTGAVLGLLWAMTFVCAATALFFTVRNPADVCSPERSRGRRLRAAWAVMLAVELICTHQFFDDTLWNDRARLMRPSALAAQIPRPARGRLSVGLSQDDEYLNMSPETYVERSRDALVPLRAMEEHLAQVEGYGAPEPLKITRALDRESRAFFDFAGAEYYVRRFKAPFADLQIVVAPDGVLPGLYRSRTAQPRAFVVHQVAHGDAKAAYQWLVDPDQPFRKSVFLEEPAALPPSDCATSTAEVVSSTPSHVDVLVNACAEGYAVLTDTHYPGWQAELDGAPAPLLRVDYLVRGVRVGPGAHRLSFHYRPRSFLFGGLASLAALVVAAAMALRRKNAGTPGE